MSQESETGNAQAGRPRAATKARPPPLPPACRARPTRGSADAGGLPAGGRGAVATRPGRAGGPRAWRSCLQTSDAASKAAFRHHFLSLSRGAPEGPAPRPRIAGLGEGVRTPHFRSALSSCFVRLGQPFAHGAPRRGPVGVTRDTAALCPWTRARARRNQTRRAWPRRTNSRNPAGLLSAAAEQGLWAAAQHGCPGRAVGTRAPKLRLRLLLTSRPHGTPPGLAAPHCGAPVPAGPAPWDFTAVRAKVSFFCLCFVAAWLA